MHYQFGRDRYESFINYQPRIIRALKRQDRVSRLQLSKVSGTLRRARARRAIA